MSAELGNAIELGPFAGSPLDAKIVNAVYYAEINATSGTISAPAGGTFIADRFSDGVDSLCTKITASSPPTDEAATEADGTPVLVSSFTVGTGAFVLSGTPSSFPVALVFAYSIALEDFDSSKTIEAVYIDDDTQTGHIIEDEGTPLTQRPTINFAGAGVTATDDSGNDATLVTIPGGGGGGGSEWGAAIDSFKTTDETVREITFTGLNFDTHDYKVVAKIFSIASPTTGIYIKWYSVEASIAAVINTNYANTSIYQAGNTVTDFQNSWNSLFRNPSLGATLVEAHATAIFCRDALQHVTCVSTQDNSESSDAQYMSLGRTVSYNKNDTSNPTKLSFYTNSAVDLFGTNTKFELFEKAK